MGDGKPWGWHLTSKSRDRELGSEVAAGFGGHQSPLQEPLEEEDWLQA